MAFGKLKFNFLDPAPKPRSMATRFGVEEEEESSFNPSIYKGLKFGGETADSSLPSLSRLLQPEEEPSSELTSDDESFAATKAYIEHMRSMPRREDYQPSFMRKLMATVGGSLSGKGGQAMAVARDIVDRPYNTKLNDWANEGSGLEDAAKAESTMGTFGLKQQDSLMRALGLQSLDNYRNRTADTRDETLEFNKDKFDKEQAARADALIKQGWKVNNIGGRVVAHNPLTQEKRDLGEDKSATIAEGNLAVNRQNAGTNAFRASNEARNTDSLIESREEAATTNRLNTGIRLLTAGKDKSGKSKNIPVREQYQSEMLAAKEVVASNPKYAKFVDEDGMVRPEADTRWSTADNSDYAEFMKLVTQKANERLKRKYDFTDDDDEEDLGGLDDLPGEY